MSGITNRSSAFRRTTLKAALLSFAAILPASAQEAVRTAEAYADEAGQKNIQLAQNSGQSVQVAQNVQLTQAGRPLSEQSAVEEVIVTSRYRQEDASKVPIAITVVDSKALETQNIYTLSQVTQLVPSLQIQGINPRNQTVSIRGLGANPGLTTEGFEPGVGIYVDNVYYARPASVLFDLFDLDRVEVLRGPQGTLFGKNTTAGALNVTTRAPSFEWGTAGQVSYGSYNFRQIQGSVTGPLTDDLAFRLTLGDTVRDDTLKTTDPDVTSTGLHNQSARLQFLYNPTDSLSLRLIGDYNHQNFRGPHQVVASALPRTLADGSTVKNWFDRLADSGYVPPAGIGTDPYARRSDINSQNYWNQESHGVSLQAEWALPSGSWLSGNTFTSISAWREFELLPSYDSDYGGSEYYKSLYIHVKQSQFSQEFRLTSAGNETVDYTVGAYLFWQKSPVDSHSIYGSQAARFSYGPTTSPAVLDGVDNNSVFGAWNSSYSVFGQANWHIDDRLSLLGGLRYTYEDKYGSNTTGIAGTYAPISSLPVGQQASAITRRNTVAPTYNYKARWDGGEISGTASLNYQWDDALMTYATYSRGFQGAGLNLAGVPATTPKVVDPETVNSYEVGTKSAWFDNRLRVNADIFWTDIENFQATIYDSTLGGRNYIANAGSVRSRGFEVDTQAVPIDGLSLTASLVYDDAIYTSLVSTPCPYLYSFNKSCNLTGGRLAGVSNWSGSATAEYAWGVGAGLEGYVGGDWTGRSSFYTQLNDDPFSKVPGYGLVGLHAGVREINQKWDVSLWSRNLLDQNYANSLSPSSSSGYVTSSLGDPQTFGVTLRAKL